MKDGGPTFPGGQRHAGGLKRKKQPKKGPTTYEQALKFPDKHIWPGCGDGRKMPCGTIHDFSYPAYYGGPVIHSFQCTENHYQGCPRPKPEPPK